MISTAEDLAIKTKFKTNEAIPLPMRIACEGIFPLKEKYETVKYCSEYARVGCFLYDLLKAASDGRPQLDMLLRLYMVPEVHDVLRNTRHIIRGYGYSSSDKNKQRPLKQYCAENSTESTEYEIPVPFSVKYRSFQAHDETTDLLKATRAQKDKFLVFHDHLYKTYLFDDIDILDFYLDKTILEPCIDMDDTIRKYAKAVKILVRKLPVYEDTVTHAETAIRMTKLFREDQVQEAWENSDDYAVRQEVKKIFGI